MTVEEALAGDAGRADGRRGGPAGILFLLLARAVGAEGHAEGRHRQAQRRGGEGAADPATHKRLDDIGQEFFPPTWQTPEALANFQKAEIDKWWPIIKAAGIKAQYDDRRINQRGANMRKLIGVAALAVIGRSCGRAGADLSVAADHAGGAVPAGRLDRRRRPHHGREDAADPRPAGHHRERRRRRRQHRGRPRRARRAGRLHHRHRPVGHPRRQHHLQSELRSAEGLRADRADLGQSAAPGRQEKSAGEPAQRAGDLDEGQSRRGQVRQPERRGARHRHPDGEGSPAPR